MKTYLVSNYLETYLNINQLAFIGILLLDMSLKKAFVILQDLEEWQRGFYLSCYV